MKRTERLDRTILGLLGVVLVGAAGVGLAAGFGAFASPSPRQRLITTSTTDWVASQDGRFWLAVIVVAVLLAVLALAWLFHQLRRVHSPSELDVPNLELGRLTLPAAVVADAVHADLVRHPAIEDAVVHVLSASPARIDAVIDVFERADVDGVKRHLAEVLGRFTSAVGAEATAGRCTLRLIETPRVTA